MKYQDIIFQIMISQKVLHYYDSDFISMLGLQFLRKNPKDGEYKHHKLLPRALNSAKIKM